MLKLEALRAKRGDALLLHHGSEDEPRLTLIDGGWKGVWRSALQPRLEQIRADRGGDPLRIGLAMCSHVDEDHVFGLLEMTDHLETQRADSQELDYRIGILWHNTFGEALNASDGELTGPVGAAASPGAVDTASVEAAAADLGVSPEAALVLASVPQGQKLRNNAAALGVTVNSPFDGLVRGGGTAGPVAFHDLEITVIGPDEDRIAEFRAEWDELKDAGLDAVSLAEFADRSPFNLASIVCVVASQGRTILLTGDARGDFVKEQAERQGLLADGPFAVDVFKVPHHGSSNNSETILYETFPATHYVISGDGSHGNPNVETFGMIFDARRDAGERIHLHLTYRPEEFRAHHGHPYPVADLEALLEAERARGTDFEVHVPDTDDALGITIDLA